MSGFTKEKLQEGFLGAVALIVLGLVIASVFQDHQGRKDWQHTGAIPTGITKLSDSDYLVTPPSEEADSFCKGDNEDGERVATVKTLMDATYVKCGRKQGWEDTRAKSGNYAAALSTVTGNFLFIMLAVGVLLLGLTPGTVSFFGERQARREASARAAKKAARAEALNETKRISLATAFGQGSIDQEEYARAMAALDGDSDGN